MSKKNNQVISIDKFNKIEELYYNRVNEFYLNLDKDTMLDVYSIITKKYKRELKKAANQQLIFCFIANNK